MKRTLSLILALVLLIGLLPSMALPADAAVGHDFEGKTISILGDGISTFEGISGDPAYYRAGKTDVGRRDTWWQQTIDALGMELLVNHSASGLCLPDSTDRCTQLHSGSKDPDYIVVFLGTNDFMDYPNTLGTADINYAALIRDNGDGTFTYAQPATSCEAYAVMLHRMTQRYENAEIYCMTLPSQIFGQPTAFNAELKKIIAYFGCTAVDLESCGMDTEDLADGWMHPNAQGMDRITDALVSAMTGQTVYDVSADLANVMLEGASAVLAGSPYTAVLTLTPDFDTLDVTVTMGGRNVTDACYTDGRIRIDAVTGDVVITASAGNAAEKYDITARRCPDCKLNTTVVDAAVAPGETASGLTEGAHCGTCGKVLLTQQVIPAATESTALPDGYVKVEFLDSTGGAYIDTGLAAGTQDKFVLYGSGLSNSYHSLMGSGSSSTASDRIQVHYLQSSGYSIRFLGAMCDTVSLPVGDIVSFILDLQNGLGYINGELVLEQSAEVLPTANNIYLFTKNINGKIDSSYTDDSRIYSYKHYRSGILVRDMVPCFRESDNEYGMYDLVGNRFYTNAGSGSFSCDSLSLTGKGAIVMNMDTGEIYYGKNIHWQNAMASTTKLMTCLLALENLDLDDRTPAAVSGDLVGGSNMGLVVGESLTVRNALYGLLLPSGNDASQLLARTVSGSYSAFIKKMNERAAELGMTNTHYSNTSGISDTNHYTTVYDMTLLMREIMKHDIFRTIALTKTYQIKADGKGGKAHSLTNVNRMIGTYEGYIGGKTGTTSGSGAHLIACAERHGSRIVAMILGSDSSHRYPDVITLLDYGFTQTPEHIYASKITAPTCTARGFTTYTCTYCAESYTDDYVDALGHTFGDWYQVEEGTCTEPGTMQRDCSRCGHTETGQAPAGEHAYESVITAPTCTEPGFTTFTCTLCGEVTLGDHTEALGHDFCEWYTVEESTCTEPGLMQRDCGRCDYTETTESPAAHTYESVVTAPSCTEPGFTTFTCTLCGEVTLGDHTEALGHDFCEWYTVEESTCTEPGLMQRDCSRCDYTETAESAAAGHAYEHVVTAPTCTEPGFTTHTCTACGDTYTDSPTEALGHDYADDVCTRCGDTLYIAAGTSGDLTWKAMKDGTLIFSGTGAMANYTYNTEMPWHAYKDQISAVVMEDGASTIGDYAFYGMDITTITIPETVTVIGNYAFKNAAHLDNVVLPSGLTRLGESAFYACTSLTAIDIPASLWTVQPYTFKNCTALQTVTFHEGNLQKIADGAFYATGLTQVHLPDCLDILDVYVFKNCAALEEITLSASLTEIRTAVLYGTAIRQIEIPEGVTFIKPYAFKNCTALESVSLPGTLLRVDEAAFYACASLEALALPDAVTEIGCYAFRKCAGLTAVEFSDDLETIGESAFYGCTGLTALDIPGKVTAIGAYAFKSCTAVSDAALPDSLTAIGDSAFHTCTGLEAIVIPTQVETIGDYSFSGSVNLHQITFLGDAPAIGSGAFNRITATACYPGGNATWTAEVMQNYGGTITWTAV